jgi:AsmA protein
VVADPVIVLAQNKKGIWNYATMTAATPAPAAAEPPANPAPQASTPVSIRLLEVTNARLTVGDLDDAKLIVLENTAITVRDFSPTAPFPFTIKGKLEAGGDFAVEGTAGPLSASDAPLQLAAKITGLKLEPYGFGGLLAMDGKGTVTSRKLNWAGTARIEHAKLTPKGKVADVPISLDFAVDHNLQRHFGAITRAVIQAGKAEAAIRGSYAQAGTGTTVNLHLTSKAMPIPEMVALLPVFDVQLPQGSALEGGTLSVDLNAAGDAGSPDVRGTVEVSNTRLKGFDLGAKMALLQRLAGIQPTPDTAIQKLTARLNVNQQGTAVDDLQLVVPAMGNLDGAGTVSATHQLNFKMKATVHTRGAVMAAIGQRQDTVIPFFIQGTSADPQFRADTASIAISELERLRGKTIGGVDAGQAVDAIKGLFGGRKKQ